MSRLKLLGSLSLVLLVGLALQPEAQSQGPQPPPKRGPEILQRLSTDAEVPGLAQPFKPTSVRASAFSR